LSGYVQAARFSDNSDGAQFNYLGSPYGEYGVVTNRTFTGEGVLNACDPNLGLADPALPPQGCLPQLYNLYGNNDLVTDRENIVNLHFGIPHRKDGGKDDIQVLYAVSALVQKEYSSLYDLGGVANIASIVQIVQVVARNNSNTTIAPVQVAQQCQQAAVSCTGAPSAGH